MASCSCLTGAVVGISVGAVGEVDIVSTTPRLKSSSPVNIPIVGRNAIYFSLDTPLVFS